GESDLDFTGEELEKMSDADLVREVERIRVYARVAPSHKMRIVDAWKKAGHIVAMTGDGVNDAPALKRSNLGVAMGITGTDVAKESADMVLTDDNFASIVAAVEEGRGIYENIRKFVAFLIFVVSAILTVGTLGVFFLELQERADAVRARTVAFTTIVFFELFLVFSMRSPRQTIWQIGLFTNTKLILAVLASMSLQVAVIYTPFLHDVFETEALSPLDWFETVLISFTAYAFVE